MVACNRKTGSSTGLAIHFGMRSCPNGWVESYRSTGKERDSETNLDYFGARYFSAAQGRFTSADKPFADQHPDNPQSWNLYGYVQNNPLNMVDPNGTDALLIADKQRNEVKIVIPVHFTGSGATPERIQQIIDRDNSIDAGQSLIKIEVISTDKPIQGVLNELDVSPGKNESMCGAAGECVNMVGGDKGHIDSNYTGANDAGPHEDLHFAGMTDKYDAKTKNGVRTSEPKPGYDDANIMATRPGTKLTPGQIQEADKNKTTKHCTTANGVTTCN